MGKSVEWMSIKCYVDIKLTLIKRNIIIILLQNKNDIKSISEKFSNVTYVQQMKTKYKAVLPKILALVNRYHYRNK